MSTLYRYIHPICNRKYLVHHHCLEYRHFVVLVVNLWCWYQLRWLQKHWKFFLQSLLSLKASYSCSWLWLLAIYQVSWISIRTTLTYQLFRMFFTSIFQVFLECSDTLCWVKALTTIVTTKWIWAKLTTWRSSSLGGSSKKKVDRVFDRSHFKGNEM